MILEKKKYTQKQLAAWFQITPQTMSTKKQQYLERLKNYARYHLEGKSIVIDEVYEEVYTKVSAMDRRIQIIDKEGGIKKYLPTGNDYTTLRDMSKKYMSNHLEEKRENPVTRAFSLVAKRDFGPYPNGVGPKGQRRTCWVKITDGGYVELTKEERDIVNKIYSKYFSSVATADKAEAYIQGEITAYELSDYIVDGYRAFLLEACTALNSPIKTVTLFTVNGITYKD